MLYIGSAPPTSRCGDFFILFHFWWEGVWLNVFGGFEVNSIYLQTVLGLWLSWAATI